MKTMNTMKTMKLTGLHQMELREAPRPEIVQDTDVLIQMAQVGICGSDVHYYAEGGIGSQRVAYPWTVGHEGAGIVAEVGPAVTRVQIGDRVALDPAQPCGVCDQCRSGRPHTCRALNFLGCPGQVEGCLAEYTRMPESSCYPIPDTMSFEQAALVEPLSIAVHAARLAAALPGHSPGETVGILGAGPIGLSALLAAKAAGAGRVFVSEPLAERRALAVQMGAEAAELETVSGAVDVIYECSGSPEALDTGVECLAPGGRFLLIGIPSSNRISLDINNLRRKELCVQNVRRQNGCVARTIAMIASGAVDVLPMVTHRLPFAQTPHGFALVSDYQDGVVKAMVEIVETD
jgi:L-iditol 2-dehydrogenase